jgi:hypothetical protein
VLSADVASTEKLSPTAREVTETPTGLPSAETIIGPVAVTAEFEMVIFPSVIAPERPTASGMTFFSAVASFDSLIVSFLI